MAKPISRLIILLSVESEDQQSVQQWSVGVLALTKVGPKFSRGAPEIPLSDLGND
jgi:hypothetical protein